MSILPLPLLFLSLLFLSLLVLPSCGLNVLVLNPQLEHWTSAKQAFWERSLGGFTREFPWYGPHMSLPLLLHFGQGINFSIFYLFSKVHFIYYNINYEICTVWRLVMGDIV